MNVERDRLDRVTQRLQSRAVLQKSKREQERTDTDPTEPVAMEVESDKKISTSGPKDSARATWHGGKFYKKVKKTNGFMKFQGGSNKAKSKSK